MAPKTKSTKSKGSMISIPSEIITEILYRLPAKSLGRFRCVTKEWLSLISDQKFIRTHVKTTNRNYIIFTDVHDRLYSQPFNYHESLLPPTLFHLEANVPLDSFFFCGSCDGLVLVSSLYKLDINDMLYNPTTRESLEFPFSGSYKKMMDDFKYCEVYDKMLGFGYDSVTDDYKAVEIFHFRDRHGLPNSVFVHVYSLRTSTWRLLTDSAYNYNYAGGFYRTYYGHCYRNNVGVFVNGFIYWIAKKSNGLRVIIAFSLADERFSETRSPSLNLGSDVDILANADCTLSVFGEKLAIFMKGEVWVMNEYGKPESWIKISIHGLNEIQMDYPRVFEDNGRILVAGNDRMLVYDVEKRSLSKIVYVWDRKTFRVVEGICVESLVSPKLTKTQWNCSGKESFKRGDRLERP